MSNEEFKKIVEDQIETIKSTLINKNKEYSNGVDVFENFNIAAKVDDIEKSEALWGMYLKHFVSVRKIVKDANEFKYPTLELLNEKITDSLNYHILLKGIIIEQINNLKNNQ